MSGVTKVRMVLNLTVDTEAWSNEYGIDPAEVGKDVQAYVGNHVREHLRELGLLKEAGR